MFIYQVSQLRSVRVTGKSLSEVLIYSSINPQYDNRLFNELRVQYEKIPRWEQVLYTNCFEFIWELDSSKYSLGTAELERTLSKTITLIWHFTKTTNIGGNSREASQQI